MTGLAPLGIAAVTLAGVGEGAGFALCGLAHPNAVKTQMTFENLAMMKFFASAVGGSMITQAIFNLYDPVTFNKSRMDPKITLGKTTFYSALMGAGLALASTGPSLVPTHTVLVENGWVLFGGSLFGCFCHALLEKFNQYRPLPDITPEEQKLFHLDKKFNVSYSRLAFAFGTAIIGASFALEYFYPHSKDLESIYGPNYNSLFNKYSLLPSLAGLFPAIAQIPLRIVGLDSAGASGSMMTIVNALSFGNLAERFKFGKNIATSSQLFYMYVGTVGGALLIKSLNPAPYEGQRLEQASYFKAFVGTALCAFAARMNQSCICSSGIGWASQLNILGFVSGASIFAGGIATAMLLKNFF